VCCVFNTRVCPVLPDSLDEFEYSMTDRHLYAIVFMIYVAHIEVEKFRKLREKSDEIQ
jgi:hypothetical protein